MPATTLAGHEIHVNDEGFLTDPDEWDEELGAALAAQIGLDDDRGALGGHRVPARRLRETRRDRDAASGLDPSAASPSSSCSPCSRRSRPRRWPTSLGCPSRTAASDPDHHQETDMTITDGSGRRPQLRHRRVTGRKLAIICSKGNLDMAYPGLILANAALGEGVETHLFFTFWGFDMINKATMGDLKFTMLGNTATHMPQGLGGLPGMTAMATLEAQEGDRRARRARGARVPRADRRLGRPPVGLPAVGRHEPPDRGRPLRRGRGHHQRQRLHRDDRTARSCCSSEEFVPTQGPRAPVALRDRRRGASAEGRLRRVGRQNRRVGSCPDVTAPRRSASRGAGVGVACGRYWARILFGRHRHLWTQAVNSASDLQVFEPVSLIDLDTKRQFLPSLLHVVARDLGRA